MNFRAATCMACAMAVAAAVTSAWAANVPLTITFDLVLIGPDSASGTFAMSGAIDDSGTAVQQFLVVPQRGLPRTVHGIKTLTSSAGTITIRFDARVSPTGPTTSVAEGRFVVLSGTGNYEGLSATGTTTAAIDFVSGSLTGSYDGNVH